MVEAPDLVDVLFSIGSQWRLRSPSGRSLLFSALLALMAFAAFAYLPSHSGPLSGLAPDQAAACGFATFNAKIDDANASNTDYAASGATSGYAGSGVRVFITAVSGDAGVQWCNLYKFSAFSETSSSASYWMYMGFDDAGTAGPCDYVANNRTTHRSYFFRGTGGQCVNNYNVIYDPPTYAEGANDGWTRNLSCTTYAAPYAAWTTTGTAQKPHSGCQGTTVGFEPAGMASGIFIDTVAPTPPSWSTTANASTFQSGNTLFFRPIANSFDITLTHTETATSTKSGANSFTWANLVPSTGWTYTGGEVASTTTSTKTLTTSTSAVSSVLAVDSNDRADNDGDNLTLTFTADSSLPAIDFINPNESTTVPTTNTTPPFNWTESDAGSGIASQSGSFQRAPIASPGVCSASWSTLSTISNPGTGYAPGAQTTGFCYRLVMTTTDNVGNVATDTSGSYLLDTTAPATPTLTDNSSSLATAYRVGNTIWFNNTAAGSVNITSTSSDAESDVASHTMNNNSTGLLIDGNPAVWTENWTAGQTTTATVSSYAKNGSNLNSSSSSVTLSADTGLPSATFTAPSAATMQSTTSYNFAWSGADSASGVKNYQRVLQSAPLTSPGVCSASWSNVTDAGLSTSSTYSATSLTDNNCWRLAVRAYDNVGNASAFVYSPSVLVDTTAPTAAGTPTTSPTGFTNATSVTITAGSAASDPQSGVTETFYRQAATITSGVCDTYGSPTLVTSPNTVVTGNCYTYFTRATNGTGATTDSASSAAVKVDTSAPVAAGAPTTSPTGFTNSTSVTITAGSAASDPQSGVTETLYRQSATLTNGVCGSYGSPTLVTSPNTVTGGNCYTYFTRATNGTGATADSASSAAVKVDTVAPVINWSVPSAAAYNSSGTITPTWTVTDTDSGIANAGVVTRQYTTLAADSCGGSWADDAVQVSGATTALTSGRCYRWNFTTAPTDNAGNATTSNLTSAVIKVDTSAPTAAGAPTTSPTGFTNVTSVTITAGTAASDPESGVAETFYRQAATMTGSTCGTYGSATLVTSPNAVVNGNCYTYFTRATNATGDTTDSASSAAVKVDTSAPTAPGAPTTSPTGFTNSTSVTITAGTSASDPESGVAETFYRQAATMTGSTCGTYGSATLVTSPNTVTGGNCYTYFTRATNGAGATADSASSAAVKVDTSAPVAAGAPTTSPTGFTNATSVTITAGTSASDPQSGVTETFYRQAATMTDGSCGSYGSATLVISPNTVTGGNCYTYFTRATNGTGATTDSANSAAVKVDATVPVVNWSSPSAAAYNTSGSITPTWTVTDADSGVANAGTVTRQYTTLVADVCGGSWTNNVTQINGNPAPLVTARCYRWNFTTPPSDNAGNQTSSNLISSVIKVDTTAPIAAGAPTTSPTGFTNSTSVTITAGTSASDPQSGVTETFYRQSATLTDGNCGSYGSATLVTSPNTVSGGNCYTYFTRATNGTGATTDSASSAAVKVDTTAPTASEPALNPASDSGIADDDGITNDTTPTFTGTAEPGVTVTLHLTGAAPGNSTTDSDVADVNGDWSITVATLDDDEYEVWVTAVDVADNTTTSDSITVVIDTVSPTAPGAPDLTIGSDNGAVDDDDLTNDTTPTFAGAGSNDSIVYLFEDSTALGNGVVADDAYSVTTSALADGQHTIFARASDLAGNESVDSAATTITIDTVAPSSVLSALSERQSSLLFPVSYNASDADSAIWNVRLYFTSITGTAIGDYTQFGPGFTSSPMDFTASADGRYYLYSRAADAAGNIEAEPSSYDTTTFVRSRDRSASTVIWTFADNDTHWDVGPTIEADTTAPSGDDSVLSLASGDSESEAILVTPGSSLTVSGSWSLDGYGATLELCYVDGACTVEATIGDIGVTTVQTIGWTDYAFSVTVDNNAAEAYLKLTVAGGEVFIDTVAWETEATSEARIFVEGSISVSVPAIVDLGTGIPGDLAEDTYDVTVISNSSAYTLDAAASDLTTAEAGDISATSLEFREGAQAFTSPADADERLTLVNSETPSAPEGTDHHITTRLLLPFTAAGVYEGTLTFYLDVN